MPSNLPKYRLNISLADVDPAVIIYFDREISERDQRIAFLEKKDAEFQLERLDILKVRDKNALQLKEAKDSRDYFSEELFDLRKEFDELEESHSLLILEHMKLCRSTIELIQEFCKSNKE